MIYRLVIPCIISMVLLLSGCARLGPKIVQSGRNQYNAAINNTEMEQLLLNIVRFRFTDNPYFLQVSSISSTVESNLTLGGSQEKGFLGGFEYTEKPTVIYSPLGGKDFVRQLLNRIDLNKLYLLAGAGWELDDILRLFVNNINGIRNAPSAVGPTPEITPKFQKFQQIADIFDRLDDKSAIVIAPPQGDTQINELILFLDPAERDSPAAHELFELLGLNPNASSYRMKIGLGKKQRDSDEIIIETRPLMGTMFFISHGVQVPEEMLNSRLVHINRPGGGKEDYNWHPMLTDLFQVKSSSGKPDNPYLAVPYKGYWFYIDDTDIDSKETMVLMSIMFQLQAGGGESISPVLTLPVGGL